jgi:transcriptional regulator with XRE-family HTH domain
MDLPEARLRRLNQLIDTKFDGKQSKFAIAVEREPNYISRILSGKKRLGEDLARDIEKRLGLPKLWLDEGSEDPAPTGGWPFKIDIFRFRRLTADQRSHIEQLVELTIEQFERGASLRIRQKKLAAR